MSVDGAVDPKAEAKAKAAEKAAEKAAKKAAMAAQRGVKAAVMTQPEEGDPLAAKYGDAPMVQSQGQSGRVWTRVDALTPAMQGQAVLVRARVHAVRGKGKSAFLVLRQRTATAQVVFFANDDTVSKGMSSTRRRSPASRSSTSRASWRCPPPPWRPAPSATWSCRRRASA